ncbi:hypothetical protein TW65_05664 [Stemphylium lycopersici]|nr:hypothetical protein TW65_05664 [Stemphylium lycopersici]
MKPRPFFSTFIIPARSTGVFTSIQRQRCIYTRAIVPVLSCKTWHDRSQHIKQGGDYEKIIGVSSRRHASSSTKPAKKPGHGIAVAPPPPSKTSKTKTPVKANPPKPIHPPPKPTSTSLAPARSPTSKSTTAPTLRAKEKLNPPPSTYAPAISVPARKADQHVVKWLWSAGRAYVNFYKTGISHVRQTAKLAKELRSRAAQTPNKAMGEVLTRAEWQIVRRSRIDVLRLPAFGFLVLVLGEWLPLVVVYITPLIPEACRIPQQVQRSLAKRESKREDRLRRIGLDAMRLMSKDRPSISTTETTSDNSSSTSPYSKGQVVPPGNTWKDMTYFELCFTAAKLDCYPALFDWIPFTPPKFLLQRNVRKKMDYLKTDSELIERDGGWTALNLEEVKRACVDRGLPVLSKKEDELRKALAGFWEKRS